jgi:hypothetical protein
LLCMTRVMQQQLCIFHFPIWCCCYPFPCFQHQHCHCCNSIFSAIFILLLQYRFFDQQRNFLSSSEISAAAAKIPDLFRSAGLVRLNWPESEPLIPN